MSLSYRDKHVKLTVLFILDTFTHVWVDKHRYTHTVGIAMLTQFYVLLSH